MLQTGLIQHAHDDLITDASYDFYGLRLATCSLDQRIKIWHLDESSGSWHVQDEWKAHEAPVSKVAWAHPEFGSVIASCSFDRTSKIWEQAPPSALLDPQLGVAGTGGQTQPVTRWIERNIMAEGKGTVRDVAFAPHYFGLKLATIASDNILRIYECIDQSSLTTWQLLQDIDVLNLPSSSTPTFYSRPHTLALGTPTQTFSSTSLGGGAGGLDKTSYADHAQALSQGLAQNAAINAANDRARHGVGNREADGGWCLSWCKDRYWGEILAASAGTSSVVKIVQLTPSRRHVTLLALDPSPSNNPASGAAGPANRPGSLSSHLNPAQTTITSQIQQQSQNPSSSNLNKSSITSLSWAPSCGRSYHLIATGSRDGSVRIWKVLPGEETDAGNESEDPRWTVASVVKVEHKSAVSRVEWNVTGTILSSAGNDGRVRLWKAGPDGEWKSAGSIGVEQAEESERGSQVDQRDVDME
ncbi:Nucleoporin SEH1 [Leucoagaricus sp. SymC.cos]|nr:Nucleoporin SEH1 [Leucoagaricus sp. SymC.cos]